MPTITTTCKTCGKDFEPDHRAIVAANWRLCPACQPQPSRETRGEERCDQSGRPLRTAGRRPCLSYLGVPAL
jgi:hypothetical protein